MSCFLGGQPADVAQGNGRGTPCLVFSFLGSGLEQASRTVGGGVEVGQAGMRERGLESLEKSVLTGALLSPEAKPGTDG